MAPTFEFGECSMIQWSKNELDGITSHYRASIPREVKPNTRPFEGMKTDQYRSTKCVTYSTSPSRVAGWLYIFTMRYYDQLGQQPQYKVEWVDKPDKAEKSKETNSYGETQISISKKISSSNEDEGVHEKLLTITIYFSTMTIMVQGNGIQRFTEGEFPSLKKFVDSMYQASSEINAEMNNKESEMDQTMIGLRVDCNDKTGIETFCKSVYTDPGNSTPNIDSENSTLSASNNPQIHDAKGKSKASDNQSSRPTQEASDNQISRPTQEASHGDSHIACSISHTDQHEILKEKRTTKLSQQEEKPLEKIASCLLLLCDVKQAISNIEEAVTSNILQVKDENTTLKLQLSEKELCKERVYSKSLEKEIKSLKRELAEAQTARQILVPCTHVKENDSNDKEISLWKTENDKLKEQVRELKATELIKESQSKRLISDQNANIERLEESRRKLISEIDSTEVRIKQKIDSIELIEGKYTKISIQLDKATDELLAWKIHDQRERLTEPTPCGCHKINSTKPDSQSEARAPASSNNKLLLIGTSIAKDIIPERVLHDYKTNLVIKYHVNEAAKYIENYSESAPAAVIFQQMSNEIKNDSKSEQQCADELAKLVEQTQRKFPQSQVIVSLPPGRGNPDLHLKTLAANVAVKQKLHKKKIVYI